MYSRIKYLHENLNPRRLYGTTFLLSIATRIFAGYAFLLHRRLIGRVKTRKPCNDGHVDISHLNARMLLKHLYRVGLTTKVIN